jgi:hypothetical protein
MIPSALLITSPSTSEQLWVAKRESNSAFYMAEQYAGADVPVFLLSAELDPHGIESGTARLYDILCRTREVCPRLAQARDHNHISINQHINTRDERYTGMMLEFIQDAIGEAVAK